MMMIFIWYKSVSRSVKGREHQKRTQPPSQEFRRLSESGEFVFCVQLGSLENCGLNWTIPYCFKCICRYLYLCMHVCMHVFICVSIYVCKYLCFISYKSVSRSVKGRKHQKLTQPPSQAFRRLSESGAFVLCVQLGLLEKIVA